MISSAHLQHLSHARVHHPFPTVLQPEPDLFFTPE